VKRGAGTIRTRDTALTGALLAFVAVASAYRAATQGIVYDEAATYLIFVAGPLEDVFTRYTANNHVLFTLLSNATIDLFGASEFTLRLPTVLAGVGYLVAAGLLARRICTTRLIFFLTVCALSLNPLVFDFLSAGRGYGLALFLFIVALLEVSREPRRQRWMIASFALGGSICANLAFAFPAVAVWVTASVIAVSRQPPARLRALIARFWLPGGLAAAAFLAIPLRNATPAHFFFGAESLLETTASLVAMSVRHHPTWWTHTWMAGWLERTLVFAGVLIAIVVSSVALAIVLRDRRLSPPVSSATGCLLVCGGTLAVTTALLVASHTFGGILYPKERTGLYLIPLAVLALASLAELTGRRAVRWPAVTILFTLTLTSIEQFSVKSYGQWRYDAGSRRIADIIASYAARQPRTVLVAAMEYFQPALEFYRQTKFENEVAPIAGVFDPSRAGDFDLVVVDAAGRRRISEPCELIYVDPVSGAQVLQCAST
jgi:hypothetical protein